MRLVCRQEAWNPVLTKDRVPIRVFAAYRQKPYWNGAGRQIKTLVLS